MSNSGPGEKPLVAKAADGTVGQGMRRGRGAGWAFLTAGLVLGLAGALRGEVREVLIKAVNVCLECIGLQ